MTTLHTVILVVHVLIGAMIVALVLLQRGKGADAGAAFGAGASGTVFGARGSANFLSRSTAVLALLFFCTSLTLAYLGTQRRAPASLLDAAVPTETAPVVTPSVGPTAPVPAGDLPALPAAAPVAPVAPNDGSKPGG
ncbi:MAG: preprotein translocase subunit SecG [Gammaproteobacteria bacterium]